MTDEDLNALERELIAAHKTVQDLSRRKIEELNARAVASCKFQLGDVIEMAEHRYRKPDKVTQFCITRINHSGWTHPRVYGHVVRKDGTLGTLEREIWGYETKGVKVGYRELLPAPE